MATEEREREKERKGDERGRSDWGVRRAAGDPPEMTSQENLERKFISESAAWLYSRCTPDSLCWMTMANKSSGEKVLLAVCRGSAAATMKELCRDLAELHKGEVREVTEDVRIE